MIDENTVERIKKRYDHIGIEWVRNSGIYAELIEPNHAKIVMPVTKQHLNHVDIVYAGTEFVAIEMSAAALFFCCYGMDDWVPIVKNISIDFLRPTRKDLVANLQMSEEEAAALLAPIKENGKGTMQMPVSLKDIDGREVARAIVTFHIIPFTKEFMK